MARRVYDLRWARAAARPVGLPVGRPRGAKAAGIRFERAVAAGLPKAKHGLWWEFEDGAGRGVCQTDLVIVGADQVLVLECKYTWTEEAWEQLRGLYLPVVAMALGRPALGLQVCRMLRPGCSDRVVHELKAGFGLALEGHRVAWHWTGLAPLEPRPARSNGPRGLASAGPAALA